MTSLKSLFSGKLAIAITVVSFTLEPLAAKPIPIPALFEATREDRQAILGLLENYTKAVSTKNQVLFETLLLNTSIPFSSADDAIRSAGQTPGSSNYPAFREAVFEGAPFTQKFEDIQIKQDGRLADVTLVFVNTEGNSMSWGLKTLQLLKIGGGWKIASEFYTSHQ